MSLQLFLLGSFRLVVKDTFVANSQWQKRKAKQLIQILALHPLHKLHREELMEMLFPDMGIKRASANLYRVLYSARHALEPNRDSYSSSSYLITDGQQIKLTATEGLWIDAEEFERKAQEGLKKNDQVLLETSAEMYRGNLLADEPFADWAIEPREKLRSFFHRVLRRMAEYAEKDEKIEDAHYWIDKILSHEPTDEIAHRAKMRLYLKSGEITLALKQYETCRRILEKEVGESPEEKTKRLWIQILSAQQNGNKG